MTDAKNKAIVVRFSAKRREAEDAKVDVKRLAERKAEHDAQMKHLELEVMYQNYMSELHAEQVASWTRVPFATSKGTFKEVPCKNVMTSTPVPEKDRCCALCHTSVPPTRCQKKKLKGQDWCAEHLPACLGEYCTYKELQNAVVHKLTVPGKPGKNWMTDETIKVQLNTLARNAFPQTPQDQYLPTSEYMRKLRNFLIWALKWKPSVHWVWYSALPDLRKIVERRKKCAQMCYQCKKDMKDDNHDGHGHHIKILERIVHLLEAMETLRQSGDPEFAVENLTAEQMMWSVDHVANFYNPPQPDHKSPLVTRPPEFFSTQQQSAPHMPRIHSWPHMEPSNSSETPFRMSPTSLSVTPPPHAFAPQAFAPQPMQMDALLPTPQPMQMDALLPTPSVKQDVAKQGLAPATLRLIAEIKRSDNYDWLYDSMHEQWDRVVSPSPPSPQSPQTVATLRKSISRERDHKQTATSSISGATPNRSRSRSRSSSSGIKDTRRTTRTERTHKQTTSSRSRISSPSSPSSRLKDTRRKARRRSPEQRQPRRHSKSRRTSTDAVRPSSGRGQKRSSPQQSGKISSRSSSRDRGSKAGTRRSR